jgi:hypothetical protein
VLHARIILRSISVKVESNLAKTHFLHNTKPLINSDHGHVD